MSGDRKTLILHDDDIRFIIDPTNCTPIVNTKTCSAKPDHSSRWNNYEPATNNAPAVHSTGSSNQACRFHCDTGFKWDGDENLCIKEIHIACHVTNVQVQGNSVSDYCK